MKPTSAQEYKMALLLLAALLAVYVVLRACVPDPGPENHQVRGMGNESPQDGKPIDGLLAEAQATGAALKRYIPIVLEADAALREASTCALGQLKVNAELQCRSICKGDDCERCEDLYAAHPYPLFEKFYDCITRCDGNGCNRCYKIGGGQTSDTERARCWDSATSRVRQLVALVPDLGKATCAAQVAAAVRAGLTKVANRQYTKAPPRRPPARPSYRLDTGPQWTSRDDDNYFWIETPWYDIHEGYDGCAKSIFLCGRGSPQFRHPCDGYSLTTALGIPDNSDEPVTPADIAHLARLQSMHGELHLVDGRTLNSDTLEPVAP